MGGLLDFAARTAEADSLDRLRDLFLREIDLHGGLTFTYAVIDPADPGFARDPMLLNAYPPDWVSRYAEAGHVRHDPVARWAPAAMAPFSWRDAAARDGGRRAGIVMAEASGFGLRDGIVVPIHGPDRRTWVVSIALPSALAPEQSVALHFLAVQFHVAYQELAARKAAPIPPRHGGILAPREADCLAWSAQGKTSAEIAAILAVTERTVNFHLTNAMRKLQAVNRIHAAVKAVHLGLVRP
jgi:DNA-binding CsgD family transcriptional regulator